jgi:hypothetical protein
MARANAFRTGLVGISLLALCGAIAAAGQPLIDRTFTDSGVAEIADCGTFKILDKYELSSTVILFFDDTGALTNFVEQNYGTDQFSNSVTGKTLRAMPFHNTVLVDRIAHTGTTSGIVFRVVVPGAGAVLLDVGRIIATRAGGVTFEAGKHQFIDGDLGGVCAALS